MKNIQKQFRSWPLIVVERNKHLQQNRRTFPELRWNSTPRSFLTFSNGFEDRTRAYKIQNLEGLDPTVLAPDPSTKTSLLPKARNFNRFRICSPPDRCHRWFRQSIHMIPKNSPIKTTLSGWYFIVYCWTGNDDDDVRSVGVAQQVPHAVDRCGRNVWAENTGREIPGLSESIHEC